MHCELRIDRKMVKYTKCQCRRLYDFIVYTGSTYDVTNYIKPKTKNFKYIDYFLKILLHKGTKQNFTDRDYEIIQYLIYRGANPTTSIRKGDNHYKLLDLVMKSKDERLIEIFVEFMRYVDDPKINPYGLHTPYFILHNTSVLAAVAYQNLDVVQYALKLSDHHNEQSFNLENTPLHIAASLPSVDITKCIVLYYPDLNARNIYLETPLFYAAKNNQIKQVRFLLEIGANFRAKDFKDKTLLHVICYQEREINVKMLEILLDAGCDPNAPDNLGRTPLHIIAKNQQTPYALEFAKLLIQRGGDVNVQNDYGDTVLHTVVDYCEDYNQFFDLLWDSGADIRKKNNNDFSYLDEILLCGCSPRRQKILKNLLIVDFSGKFRIGFNPISYMKEDHQLEIDCREELQRLKSRKIEKFETEPEYSFIRFFFLNEIQISKLCSNPKLRTSIAKFNEKEYKHYGSRLKTILALGLRIFYENEDGHKFFSILSGGEFNFYIISDIMKIIPLRKRYKFRQFLDPQTEPQTIKKMMQREELKNKKSIKYKIEKRQIVFNPKK